MEEKGLIRMHIVMYPWFAFGHLSSFLDLSNKLAEVGHTISFLHPPKAEPQLAPLILHPEAIRLVPVAVPTLPGLPEGAETTADVAFPLQPLLMSAMDLTRPRVEALLSSLRPRPGLVVFDFAHWVPALARPLGIKSLHYCTVSPATIGYLLSPSRPLPVAPSHLMRPPPGFPSSSITLSTHEAHALLAIHSNSTGAMSFQERQMAALTRCDALAFRGTLELDGPFCRYLEQQFAKPVLLAGPVLPGAPRGAPALDQKLGGWLGGFGEGSVVYCALGSECVLPRGQCEELLRGLELTGRPFLAVLKGQEEAAAAPAGRGLVCGEWVQQQLILGHRAVGCFVTHCGSGSLSEAMVAECQLVLLPDKGDQIINARVMGGDLRVGVEVGRGDRDGLFTARGVCDAIQAVMDQGSPLANELRANHHTNRALLLNPAFQASYFNTFLHKLEHLLHSAPPPAPAPAPATQ